jgi:membrane protein implicated in regulation of membrane protease activity
MLARLGIVIYWLGWIVAALIVLGGFAMLSDPRVDKVGVLIAFSIAAFVVWLIGYAFRYILAGPKATAQQSKTKMLHESFVPAAPEVNRACRCSGDVASWDAGGASKTNNRFLVA